MFETLITVVNVNFLFIYLLTILSFAKHYNSKTDYAMSAVAIVLTSYLFTLFGIFAAICLAVFFIITLVMIHFPQRTNIY